MANQGLPYGHSMMQQGIGQQYPVNNIMGSQQGMMGTQQGMMGSAPGMMGSQQTQSGIMGHQNQNPLPQQIPQILSPTKEVNLVTMCKKGQECVQDLFNKVSEIFKILQTKNNLLPNGITCNNQMHQDRRGKLDEQLQQLTLLFKKIRVFYDKINEVCPEEPTEENMVAVVGQQFEDGITPSAESQYKFKVGNEEHREIVEQLRLKNRQLKAIIDQMRTIIWEINTMMVMRKT